MIKLTCLSFIYLNVCNRVCNNVYSHAICSTLRALFLFSVVLFRVRNCLLLLLKNEDVQIYRVHCPKIYLKNSTHWYEYSFFFCLSNSMHDILKFIEGHHIWKLWHNQQKRRSSFCVRIVLLRDGKQEKSSTANIHYHSIG